MLLLSCAACAGSSTKEGSATTGTTTTVPPMKAYPYPESCLWYRGAKKWCMSGWGDDEWGISQYEGREHRGRYYVENHRGEVLGYLRPSGRPGTLRAMVSVCFPDARPCGWARGGRAVRVSRNVRDIYKRGRRIGTARGPAAIAVAAYWLVIGD